MWQANQRTLRLIVSTFKALPFLSKGTNKMDAVPVSVSEINDRIKNYTLENTRFCGVVRTFLPGNEVDMDMCVIDVPGDVSIDPVALRFLGNGPKLVGLTVEFGLTNDRRVVNVKQI